MVTRVIGLLLGLALGLYGYGTMDPTGVVSPYIPAGRLGPFTSQAALIGQIALAFGIILIVAAVLPRGRKAKQAVAEPVPEPEPAPKMSGGAQPSPLW